MTDTTDIKALREGLIELLDHVDSYGGKCWLFPEDVRSIISSLDQLEAERHRAERNDSMLSECLESLKAAEAELAALKGDQVPVCEADYTRYSCGCCGFDSLHHTTKCPECNYHKIESESLFTTPQKPVVLPEMISALYRTGFNENYCALEVYRVKDVKAAIEAAGGIVKGGD